MEAEIAIIFGFLTNNIDFLKRRFLIKLVAQLADDSKFIQFQLILNQIINICLKFYIEIFILM